LFGLDHNIQGAVEIIEHERIEDIRRRLMAVQDKHGDGIGQLLNPEVLGLKKGHSTLDFDAARLLGEMMRKASLPYTMPARYGN
jgi:hypothetical protein